jgi:hypothetical protein
MKKETISFQKSNSNFTFDLLEDYSNLFEQLINKMGKINISTVIASAALFQYIIDNRIRFDIEINSYSKFIYDEDSFLVYEFKTSKLVFQDIFTEINRELDKFLISS